MQISHKDNVCSSAVGKQLKQKKSNSQAQLHLPALDLFWVSFFVRVQLTSLLLISPGLWSSACYQHHLSTATSAAAGVTAFFSSLIWSQSSLLLCHLLRWFPPLPFDSGSVPDDSASSAMQTAATRPFCELQAPLGSAQLITFTVITLCLVRILHDGVLQNMSSKIMAGSGTSFSCVYIYMHMHVCVCMCMSVCMHECVCVT